jgi:hypothetical protein
MFIASINAKKKPSSNISQSFLFTYWSVGRIRILLFKYMWIRIQGAKPMRIHILFVYC